MGSFMLEADDVGIKAALNRSTFALIASVVSIMVAVLLDDSSESSVPASDTSEEIQNREEIQKKIEEVNNRVDALNYSLEDAKENITDLLISAPVTKAFFTPDTKEFASLDTNLGKIFLKLRDIQEYANGYKVTFQVGNPHGFYLSKPTIKIEWGKAAEEAQKEKSFDFSLWKQSLKSKTEELNKNIQPFRWNEVTLILNDTAKDELGYMRLEVDFNAVSSLH
jgi:hypothetical protein